MDRPLTALFVDCDSYFASVEQHLDPALRSRPVGVPPVMAESSCCIAASYEAKAFGVKTGTRISDARVICPGIAIVESKPSEYIRFHHQIIAAVEDCIHVEAVLSIDEMWAWLPYYLREPSTVEAIGRRIKETVARDVSPVIKVSIGAGPNRYLAKTASKTKKPDGLFIIEHHDLPQVLHQLKLRDLKGIARSMETRLHANGVHTVADLCDASKPLLHQVWGGVLGDRLWHLLRGDEIPDLVSARKTIGQSHVLPLAGVGPDKASSMAAATGRLIGLGHRKISLLCRRQRRLPQPGLSERAFLDELAAHGIPTGAFNLPEWEESMKGLGALLDSLFAATPPTALILDEAFLFNAAFHYLAKRNLRVLQDVSLVCTDSDPRYA